MAHHNAAFGRRKAAITEALNERLAKIRPALVKTSDTKVSARTSASGIPLRSATM